MGNKNDEYHFILVHGDCHGAWCWYKVKTLLERAGHKVTALDMAGCGIHDKRVEQVSVITDYFQPLMLFMEALPMNERVVLVGHSRGGVDISLVMERYPTKIAAAVFVTAAMPGPGLELPAISKKFAGQMDSRMDSCYYYNQGEDKPPTAFLFGPVFLASNVYQLSPPEDLTLAKFLMRPCPLHNDFSCLTEETALTQENHGSIPRIFIVCDQDKLMKEEMQRWLCINNPPNEVKEIKGADHMVMMSKPHELCSCLQEIGDKYCRVLIQK